MENQKTINNFGLFSTIVVTVVGVRIFSYARELANYVGNDVWVITIASGLIGFGLLLIIFKVIKLNNYESFYKLCVINLGKILGTIVALSMALNSLLYISLGMRGVIEELKMYLLEITPTEVLILVTILVGTYLIRGKVEAVVRFNEIAFWIMFAPTLIILLCTLNNADFTNLLPILKEKPINYIKATTATINRYEGLEIIFLIAPLVKFKDKINKTLEKSMLFVTIFYTIIVIIVIAVFTKDQTKLLLWPVITMIKSINIPGGFVERWDGIILTLWVIFFFTTFTNGYYFAADILKESFKFEDIKLSCLIVIPVIYVMALYPDNIAEADSIVNNVIPIMFFINLVLVPIILLIATKIRRKGGGNNSIGSN